MTVAGGSPKTGMSLGWRLGLFVSLFVSILMAAVTAVQLTREIESQRSLREDLLRKALAPLVVAVEEAGSRAEIADRLGSFHRAYQKAGYGRHQVRIRDVRGGLLASSFSGDSPNSKKDLRASLPFSSSRAGGISGEIVVWEDPSGFDTQVREQWISWFFHVCVTIVGILCVILSGCYLMVGRPLGRLLEGMRRMEMGYWEETLVPDGAWEFRWLAWRFGNLGKELNQTVGALVKAERRSLAARNSFGASGPGPAQNGEKSHGRKSGFRKGLRESIWNRLKQLESSKAPDQDALPLARRVLSSDVNLAGRMGDWKLKARLENAAFRLLEPEAYREIEERLKSRALSIDEWARKEESALRRLLEGEKVPWTRLSYRVKHAAGIWKKMKLKGLEFGQIHDLIAFRIIVPTESDCYWVLGLAHENYEPIFGRFNDFVAHPKGNGYQSLHTCVRSGDKTVFELQIRSTAMHRNAEGGSAAHWRYKKDSSWNEGETGGFGSSIGGASYFSIGGQK